MQCIMPFKDYPKAERAQPIGLRVLGPEQTLNQKNQLAYGPQTSCGPQMTAHSRCTWVT